MEIKFVLEQPYTDNDKMQFIKKCNNEKLQIEYSNDTLIAWGYTEKEKQQQQQERIAMLKLTRGDVFRGLLQAKGITRAMLRTTIEAMPEETQEQALIKEMALIDFDEALDFYRGNALIDTVGLQLGITKEQLDSFFETNDYTKLISQ